MSWWSVAPEILLAAAILLFPGALVGRAAGLSGFGLIAIASPISVSLVSISAVLASLAGIAWSLIPVIVAAVAAAGGAVFVQWRFAGSRPAPPSPGHQGLVLAVELGAVVLAGIATGSRLLRVFGAPEAFSQTFDNVFHLNAVRYILDTGSGSSLTVGQMTGGAFYPSAWHDLISLVVMASDAPISVATNAVNLFVAAFVWPVSCIYLAGAVVGRRPAVAWCAAAIASAFGAFPLSMLDFGVLYPNFLAISFLPVAVGLGLKMLRAVEPEGDCAFPALALTAVLPGLTLAHPSATLTLMALLAPVAVFVWCRSLIRSVRRHGCSFRRAVLHLAVLGIALTVAVVIWSYVRPPEEASSWPPIESPLRAAFEVVTNSAIGRPIAWAMSALTLVGIAVTFIRRKMLWLLGMYLVGATLFVVAASFQQGRLRMFVTGVWYNDPPRLAALLPVVVLPLAVVGAVAVWDWMRSFGDHAVIQGNRSRSVRGLVPIAGVVATSLLILSTQQATLQVAEEAASRTYRMDAESPLVTPDELSVLLRLKDHVPSDAIILGNPWNGSALAYALGERKTLQLHILGALQPGAQLLYDHLDDALTNPEVCEAVASLNIEYVLDFGHREVNFAAERRDMFAGLDQLQQNGVAELVDSQGAAKLFKITACAANDSARLPAH